MELLVGSLNDPDEAVTRAIVWGLDELGWEPSKSKAGAIYWITKRQWSKCTDIGAPAVEPLIASFQDQSTRQAAIGALRAMDIRAVDPLIAALGNQKTCQAAAEALGVIGASAVRPLVAALQDKSRDNRRIAAKILVEMHNSGRLDDQQKRLILI